jgi:hypothetical protein
MDKLKEEGAMGETRWKSGYRVLFFLLLSHIVRVE